MNQRRWVIREACEQAASISQELGISPLLSQLLCSRGIGDLKQAKRFLSGGIDDLHSPFLMEDMEPAVARLRKALDNGEPIVVFGDYDADGQTGTALLVAVFRSLCAHPDRITYYIPDRMWEGYGPNCEAIRELSKANQLVVTVDCGVASTQEAKLARHLGLDMIITDHHEPSEELPLAVAVLNPKRASCSYPFQGLAGVGVAYKLAQALGEVYGRDFSEHLDLVALGTVADMVPLTGENRLLTKAGLEMFSSTQKPGLRSLLEVCRLSKKVTASDLGFRLGPRLNAGGRMGSSDRGVELLLTTDRQQAAQLAKELDEENCQRQSIEGQIVQEARELVERQKWQSDPAIVVASDQWHPGVIGIVASRLVNAYYRPTVVISLHGDEGKGSARSILGFDLYQGLTHCQDLLIRYGGHEMAAGLSIASEAVPAFRERMQTLVAASLQPEDYVPEVVVDAEVSADQLTEDLVQELELLEPCGQGNPAPVFQLTAAALDWRLVGRESTHLQCRVQAECGQPLQTIGFGLGKLLPYVKDYRSRLNFLFRPQMNEWNNQRKLQLVLQDIQPYGVGREPITTTFVDRTMESFPWDLPPEYAIPALLEMPINGTVKAVAEGQSSQVHIEDRRGCVDKPGYIANTCSSQEQVLIYEPTPARVLQRCRQLRLTVNSSQQHIGFAHEYLGDDERTELQDLISQGTIRWLVTTGFTGEMDWTQVVWGGLPLGYDRAFALASAVAPGGTLHILYGERDRKALHRQICQVYPDRDQLAQFYRALARRPPGVRSENEIASALAEAGLLPGNCFPVDVFVELRLLEVSDQGVRLLPVPQEKLDLRSSVLYNEGMHKREQLLLFIRNSRERGFFHGFAG